MGNVKVRKQRHLRQGADANPFPTTEQILANVAAGVVTNLAQRVIAKAVDRINAFGKNNKAGARVTVPQRGVQFAEEGVKTNAKKPSKKKAKR